MSGRSSTPRGSRHVEALEKELRFLYGDAGEDTLRRLRQRLEEHGRRNPPRPVSPAERLSETDVMLITYGDTFSSAGEPPLRTLARVLDRHVGEAVSIVHLLPFYPSSSDDGFSVVDYRRVDPSLGDWQDVAELARRKRLAVDVVLNHVSATSAYFQGFRTGRRPFTDFFIEVEPGTDLSQVVRPRATPLLTPVDTPFGTKHVWTTFSEDQIDLDYRNPDVLLELVDVMLGYIERGAEILRLDAVTYLWKELGTSCVHHPKTHGVIRVLRGVVEAVAPHVVLLTETNVPHDENVSYFGNGHDEAQIVYNFALPPLVMHTLLQGDATALSSWAAGLTTPSDQTCFLNFLASHDGIGVRPVEALLSEEERAALVAATERNGGRVSRKSNPDGSLSPYELNISYFDAVNGTAARRPRELEVRRFLTAHAIAMSLAGVPAIYVHSLFGSRSAPEEVARTGRARSINRARLQLTELERELVAPGSRRAAVLAGFRELLRVRRRHTAFHPQAPQRVLDTSRWVFGVLRGSERRVACLHNVSDAPQMVPRKLLPSGAARDLLGERRGTEDGAIELAPAETRWIELG